MVTSFFISWSSFEAVVLRLINETTFTSQHRRVLKWLMQQWPVHNRPACPVWGGWSKDSSCCSQRIGLGPYEVCGRRGIPLPDAYSVRQSLLKTRRSMHSCLLYYWWSHYLWLIDWLIVSRGVYPAKVLVHFYPTIRMLHDTPCTACSNLTVMLFIFRLLALICFV